MLTELSPQEYDVVHAAFKSLAQSDWFERTSPNEEACAKLVLHIYGNGGLEADELRTRCESIAKQRFSRSAGPE